MLMAKGIKDKAAPLYRQAAELESQVFDGIPISRPRTRGIIAVSTVALYRKAGELAKAIRQAHRYLTDPELPEFAQEELRDLLFESYREQKARASGHVLGMKGLAVSFSRGSIGLGVARLDTVVLKLQQFERYILRVGEWVAGKQFREGGPHEPDVLQACTPVLSEPSAGSFQFELRLETPLQPPLPSLVSDLSLTPERITETAFRILDIIASPSTVPENRRQDARQQRLTLDKVDISASTKQFEQEIPDDQYRETFLKLVRNLVPDGKHVGEIRISTISGGGSASMVLTPELHKIIRRHLSRYIPEPERENVQVGVLRALHLDKGWIVLVSNGQEHMCYIQQHKVFDDVVGPFVNHRVRVPGQLTGTGRQRKFVLRDIVLDIEGTD